MPITILSQALSTPAIYNERLAIVMGLATLLLGISLFLSCRVCISWFGLLGLKGLAQTKGYLFFYKRHLYYWWAFGILLVSHIMVSTLHTGFPQSSDPDAGVHWIILGSGLFSGISAGSVFFSCRVLPNLLAMLTPDKPIYRPRYRSFYKYHSYFWLALASLVITHLAISYNHTGFWPSG